MKKSLLLILLSFSLSVKAQTPTFEWARTIGSVEGEGGQSITTDSDGNVYLLGYFSGTVDVDPGPESYLLTSLNNYNIFIAKYNPQGGIIWAKSLKGMSSGRSVKVDGYKNVYFCGHFANTVDADPGENTVSINPGGDKYNSFVEKLDSNGNFVWVKVFGGADELFGGGLSLSSDDNSIYFSGSFKGSQDLDPGSTSTIFTSQGNSDAFILKMDTNGSYLWAKQLGGSEYQSANQLEIDKNGMINVLGEFYGTTDFDPGSGEYFLTSKGSGDIFISRFDTNGNFIFTKSFGNEGYNYPGAMAISQSGTIMLTGIFSGSIDLDPGEGVETITSKGAENMFITKLGADGAFLWAKNIGGNEGGCVDNAAVSDEFDNLYLTGVFFDTADFSSGPTPVKLVAAGQRDIFIAKYDGSGNLVWVRGFGAQGFDYGSSLHLDKQSNIYFTGGYMNTIDFNPEQGVQNIPSVGDFDLFVEKFSQNSVLPLDLITFSVIRKDSYVTINWSTTVGNNGGQDFVIERADDTKVFRELKAVKAAPGNLSYTKFEEKDFAPYPNTSYYRLKSTQKDGTVFYSKVIPVTFSLELKNPVVYPNPTNGLLKLDLAGIIGDSGDLRVYNTNGQHVLNKKLNTEGSLDLSQLPDGQYILQYLKNGKILNIFKVQKTAY